MCVCVSWLLVGVSHLRQVLLVSVFVAWYVSASGPLSISIQTSNDTL